MVSRNAAATISPRIAASLLLSFATLSLALGASSAVPQPPGPATPRDRETLADNFVREKLHLWQQRLNLTDWDVHINLVRTSQLEPKTLGNIHWDTDARQATIAVLSSRDYRLPWQAMLDDMEFTVVHELVHLRLASLPHSAASRRPEEQAVNELARALLNLAKH
jgi:hypothetical protein